MREFSYPGQPYEYDDPKPEGKLDHQDERSASIHGLGTVRVRGMRCGCGRQLEPRDFEAIDSSTIRAICPNCNVATVQLDLDELGHDDED